MAQEAPRCFDGFPASSSRRDRTPPPGSATTSSSPPVAPGATPPSGAPRLRGLYKRSKAHRHELFMNTRLLPHLLLVLSAFSSIALAGPAPRRPNVVFI